MPKTTPHKLFGEIAAGPTTRMIAAPIAPKNSDYPESDSDASALRASRICVRKARIISQSAHSCVSF